MFTANAFARIFVTNNDYVRDKAKKRIRVRFLDVAAPVYARRGDSPVPLPVRKQGRRDIDGQMSIQPRHPPFASLLKFTESLSNCLYAYFGQRAFFGKL